MDGEITTMPDKATVCTIETSGDTVYINCAGFKHRFTNYVQAAKYLNLPWEEFVDLLAAEHELLILLRHNAKEKWHSSRLLID